MSGFARMFRITGIILWPGTRRHGPGWQFISSLLPCTVILTLPLGGVFVLSGWSALPDLILVLCLSLSIGMPLLKSLGFLPTMPQLNYKISALEQVLDAPELQQTPDSFHGKDDTIVYDHVSFGYTKTQPGPDGKAHGGGG